MTDLATPDAYGMLTEPATLKIQRLLPGPVERIWAYLTDSNLRRQWMAAGAMEMKVGSSVELVWHNDELTDPPGVRPAGFSSEHRMESEITECDPPRKLAFTWGSTGGVSFELQPRGNDVLLTVIHRRILERNMRLMIGAGWHAHLDILVARVTGQQKQTEPFWDGWSRLRAEYDRRLPA